MPDDIIAYDHTTTRELKGGLLSKIGDLALHSVYGSANEIDAVEEMKDKAIVVAHFSHNSNWQSLLDQSPANSLRIRVSTVSRIGIPHQLTPGGVIELNMQVSHSYVEYKEWQLILGVLSEIELARKTAEGYVPSGLEKYFSTSALEHLSALSILCQGCLAVLNPAALGDANGFIKNLAILDNAKQEVLSPAWWLDVLYPSLKANVSTDIEAIQKEWPEPSDQKMMTHWTNMHSFLNVLLIAKKSRSLLIPERLTPLAKQAYVAINARLELAELARNG